MNIIIQDIDGTVKCRPDTTWERENKDLYSPDFVTGYSFAPVLFARICKAGKFVGAKFAGRYYDAVNYGVLLYPEVRDFCAAEQVTADAADGNALRDAEAAKQGPAGSTLLTIMDRTSFLPGPMYNRVTLESGENVFELKFGDKVIYSTCCGKEAMIESAIVNASRYISVRIGDLIVIELQPPAPLPLSTGEPHISATFCGNWLFDFHIK